MSDPRAPHTPPRTPPVYDDPTPLRAETPIARRPTDGDAPTDARLAATRPASYRPRRARWPGLLAAGVVGAAIGGVVLMNMMPREPAGVARAPTGAAPAPAMPAAPSADPTAGTSVPDASQVLPPTGTATADTAPDATITAAVKAALAADPTLAPQAIDVKTANGVVTLTGPAPDEPSRARAALLAAGPDGVQRVDNQLVVTSKGA